MSIWTKDNKVQATEIERMGNEIYWHKNIQHFEYANKIISLRSRTLTMIRSRPLIMPVNWWMNSPDSALTL